MSSSGKIYGILVSGAGFLGLIANSIQLVLTCSDKQQFSSAFGIVLLSLNVADTFVSITCILLGMAFLFGRSVFDASLYAKITDVLYASMTFSFFASFTHIVFIAIQRVVAVVLPLRAKRIMTKHRCCTILVLLWVISVSLVFPAASGSSRVIACMALSTAAALLVTYSIICFKMQQQSSNQQIQGRNRQAERQVFLHSIAVTVIFIICYFPESLHTFIFYPDEATFVSSFLVAINPFLDTLVYFMLSYWQRRRRVVQQFQEQLQMQAPP